MGILFDENLKIQLLLQLFVDYLSQMGVPKRNDKPENIIVTFFVDLLFSYQNVHHEDLHLSMNEDI